MHTNGRVDSIVDHDNNNIGLVLHRCRQFLAIHHEIAVASKRDHGSIWIHQFRRNGGWHAVAHRAAGWRKLRPIFAKTIKTVKPGRIIAGTIANNRIVSRILFDCFDDIG